MAIIIKEAIIDDFRGVRDLHLEKLNHVNIIVGDNNCGKTSVLEAIYALSNPSSITHMMRVARLRDSYPGRESSIFESFRKMFNQRKETSIHVVDIKAFLGNGKGLFCNMIVEGKKILVERSDFEVLPKYRSGKKKEHVLPERMEISSIEGSLSGGYTTNIKSTRIMLNEYSRTTGMFIEKEDLLNIQYLSPSDHIKKSVMNEIVVNESYKQFCIEILKIFDEDIKDLLLLENEVTGRPVEYVRHSKMGNMPMSTYGDGLRKVLSLANAIAKVKNGVLLIDEVETAIHSKYYYQIFSFLVMACKQFNVQLFITTHSIEAVDGLLSTQNYDDQDEIDDISVCTLKKVEERTLSRVLSGRQVHNNRTAFDFEVRL